MRRNAARTFAVMVVLGFPSFTQAQDTSKVASKPAGVQDDLGDNENAYTARYFSTLWNASTHPTSVDRMFLAHAGIAACTSCHAVPATNATNTAPEARLKTVFYALRAQADPTLGATLEPLEDAVRTQLGLKEKSGLLVTSLAAEGPAEKVGLKTNDILLTLADTPLTESGDLAKQLKQAGEKEVALGLLRAGKSVKIQVRPITRITLGPVEPTKVDYYIGVSASPPDDVLKAHVTLPEGQGLLVNDVVPQSPAEKGGVHKFDILLKLNDKPLDRTESLSAQVQTIGGKPAPLQILRAGKTITLTVKPEPRKASNEKLAFEVESVVSTLNWNVVNPYPYPVQLQNGFVTGNLIQNPAPDPSATARRLDDLDKEMKALRKALEEVRDAIKKEK